MNRFSLRSSRSSVACDYNEKMTKLVLVVVLLAVAGSIFAVPVVRADSLDKVNSFALALGADTSEVSVEQKLGHYQLVVVDGQETSRSVISHLRNQGVLVLGYLSIGTIEPWRPWYGKLKKYRLSGKSWGEPYADVNRSGYRQAIRDIAGSISDKGFDGLFFDNSDMVEVYPSRKPGMRLLLSTLAGQQRQAKKLVVMQNNFTFLRNYSDYFDGWNREDVSSTYNFTKRRYQATSSAEQDQAGRELRAMRQLGLKTLATDYYRAAANPLAGQLFACSQGAVSFVSNIQLSRLSPPFLCP